jgi:hypothetical protein
MLKTIKMPNEYRQLKNYLPPKNYKELKVIKYSRTQFFNTIGAINEHQQKTTGLLPKINNTVGQINEKKKAPYLSIKLKKKKGLKKNKSVDAKEVMVTLQFRTRTSCLGSVGTVTSPKRRYQDSSLLMTKRKETWNY